MRNADAEGGYVNGSVLELAAHNLNIGHWPLTDTIMRIQTDN